MRRALFFLASISLPAAAQAQDMRLDTFLEKADRLEKRGPLALFSDDLDILKSEVEASARQYRARIAADREAGRSPHSCPPERGGAKLGSDELLRHFRSYPASRRTSLTVRQGFFDLMASRFPCG